MNLFGEIIISSFLHHFYSLPLFTFISFHLSFLFDLIFMLYLSWSNIVKLGHIFISWWSLFGLNLLSIIINFSLFWFDQIYLIYASHLSHFNFNPEEVGIFYHGCKLFSSTTIYFLLIYLIFLVLWLFLSSDIVSILVFKTITIRLYI